MGSEMCIRDSVKTVEWHLRNAFVKLRITSRRELQPVLREAA